MAAEAQFGERHQAGGVGKCSDNALVERAGAGCSQISAVDDLQREDGITLRQLDHHDCQRERGAVLDHTFMGDNPAELGFQKRKVP